MHLTLLEEKSHGNVILIHLVQIMESILFSLKFIKIVTVLILVQQMNYLPYIITQLWVILMLILYRPQIFQLLVYLMLSHAMIVIISHSVNLAL